MTDVVMPAMAGPTMVELAAQHRPDVKALYLSGYSDESAFPHGPLGPGRALLSKPFGGEVLLRKVRESLDGVEA